MPSKGLFWKHFPSGPLQCNCTLIAHPESKGGIVVDPGGDIDIILNFLAEHQVKHLLILHTHAHFDHILAAGELKARTGGSLALHPGDAMLWDHLEDQCRMFRVPFNPLPPVDLWLEDTQEFDLGATKVQCLHTPGHTPGSTSFLLENLGLLIAGDTLFRGSIGRTDLWGGDSTQITRSIKEKIYKLDESIQVVTGHGALTSIGQEMRTNPFVRA